MTAVPDTLTTPVADLVARARAYVTHSYAKNILDAYDADRYSLRNQSIQRRRRSVSGME